MTLMEEKRAFGELELAILKLFQPHARLSVRQVVALLGSEDKYTSVMTVMNRLVTKRSLQRERVGLHYEYWLGSQAPAHTSLMEKFKRHFFGASRVSMASYLLEEESEFSEEDLEQLERRIQQMREKLKEPSHE